MTLARNLKFDRPAQRVSVHTHKHVPKHGHAASVTRQILGKGVRKAKAAGAGPSRKHAALRDVCEEADCPASWIGDGYCDTECLGAACKEDGGDCLEECASGCPISWINDDYCDPACQNEACSHDGNDCGGGGGQSLAPDCGDFATLPQDYVDVGVAADTVLSSADCPENVLAYASHCQLGHNDRPTFGYIQMCAGTHQPKDLPGQRDEDFHTAVHEITHILGMSSALFPYFRDENNNPRSIRCPEMYEGDTKNETGLFYDGQTVHYWKDPWDQVGWCCTDWSLGHPPFRCEAENLELLIDQSVVEVVEVASPPSNLDFAGHWKQDTHDGKDTDDGPYVPVLMTKPSCPWMRMPTAV